MTANIHAVLWLPLILATTLLPLRAMKSLLIALQFHHKAAEGRLIDRGPRSRRLASMVGTLRFGHPTDFARPTDYPLTSRSSMVPRDFAFGKIRSSINIKGLAVAKSLWRAV
jgi:hypothetical protein